VRCLLAVLFIALITVAVVVISFSSISFISINASNLLVKIKLGTIIVISTYIVTGLSISKGSNSKIRRPK
jgi:hypothetical protein